MQRVTMAISRENRIIFSTLLADYFVKIKTNTKTCKDMIIAEKCVKK